MGEPDYPPVKPTTCFRLGSVGKLVGGIGLYQLAAEGVFSMEDKLPDVLPLTRPNGDPQAHPAYDNGLVRHLIEKKGLEDRKLLQAGTRGRLA